MIPDKDILRFAYFPQSDLTSTIPSHAITTVKKAGIRFIPSHAGIYTRRVKRPNSAESPRSAAVTRGYTSARHVTALVIMMPKKNVGAAILASIPIVAGISGLEKASSVCTPTYAINIPENNNTRPINPNFPVREAWQA